MMRCGLLGEKLGHSYSPAIHAQLADYAYVLETGTITKSGTGAELLADESIKEAYLGKAKA